MPKLVRALTASGFEVHVSDETARDSDDLTVIDDDAPVIFGRTPPMTRKGGRPALPSTSVDEEAKNKPAGKSAKNEGTN